jgi:hypothetical protein
LRVFIKGGGEVHFSTFGPREDEGASRIDGASEIRIVPYGTLRIGEAWGRSLGALNPA